MPADTPDCFALLAQALRSIGMEQEAEELSSSIAAGSTGTECLGLAGRVIAELRSAHSHEAGAVLRPFIEPCITEIRRAWPRYA
jgi:hypothetical protein